jgi:hypothetical protein
MTWTLSSSGSQTAVIGTEHTLTTDTTNATYYYEVDMNNLANADVLELRIYTMTASGGTLRVAWKSTFGPIPPVNLISPSPPQPSDQSCRVALKQIAGTGRVFPWKLLRS